ncbi:MAG TPA: DmsC/YnfH family molybdoenzyme membrane anchor subunit [Rudaea sp.]|nr:DmsC/YnfH family molybdoenzyme membrane anchor subunit [Rudaea sp.]
MYPAFSVLFFTTISGCGYGLLFLLGLSLAANPLLFVRNESLLVLAAGTFFSAAGLTSSLLHLGQPQRAWRALSQWRSSWLSREGVAALVSFVPVLALAAAIWRGDSGAVVRVAAVALAVMAVITVCCTAKIYTSLKTIRAWHNGLVLPGYLAFALLGGAAMLWMLLAASGSDDALVRANLPAIVAILAAACAVIKREYWRFVDTTPAGSSAESATGLGRFGTVRGVEAPHTEENYLTNEMGFVLARKHAARLRVIALVLFALLPVALVVPAMLLQSMALVTLCAFVVVLGVIAGTFVERWLFFAEAKHVVMLYYAGTRAQE